MVGVCASNCRLHSGSHSEDGHVLQSCGCCGPFNLPYTVWTLTAASRPGGPRGAETRRGEAQVDDGDDVEEHSGHTAVSAAATDT
ncbi:hypothetical protein GN956_G9513 [Arapaima gigas]